MATRRQRGEGSVYQRADGMWVGNLNLGYRDGKRRRKVVYGRTQREALRKLGEVKRTATPDMPTASRTLASWMTEWLESVAPNHEDMKPRTLSTYREKTRNYIVPHLGRHRLDKLTPAQVRGMHRWITQDQGLSTTTAMHAHRVLSVALRDAMREGLVPRNVASREYVDSPRKAANDRRGMSLPEALAVLREAGRDERLGGRWLVALMLGLRQGERLAMRWDLLDLDKGVADLSWQLQRIPYKHGCGDSCGRRGADRCPQRELDAQPGFSYQRLEGNLCLQRPKTRGSTRVVALPGPTIAALAARRELASAERPGYEVDHDLVWCREDGRPVDAGEDWRAWRDLLQACGMPHLTQHEARHTTATLLQSMGVDEATRMAIMGHSEAATQRGYAHVDLTLQRQALDALGERLSIAR